MSIGGSSKAAQGLDTNLQQGPFEYGPSQFDISQINQAVGQNQDAIQNRYNQLGLGGSTAEGTDLSQQTQLGQAAQGQLQTSEVTQPAFNPALQSAQTNLSDQAILGSGGSGVSLGSLAGSAASLGGLL